MKTFTRFYTFSALIVITGILLGGCKKENTFNSTPSTLCSGLTGVEGLYWDLANGVSRTDIPGGVPHIAHIGGTYIHPTVPLLTFIYPTGYTPYTDNTSGAVGVNLIRNDNQSIWRYTNIEYTGTPTTASAVLSTEVASLKSFLGSTGTVTTVCSEQGTLPRAPGIVANAASVFIRFDNYTAVVNIGITTESGLAFQQITISVSAAPTSQFANEVMQTYLPIAYQLLYTGDGEIDSDGDGYPDDIDNFPFDPTRH
jgi:hypothetical protein